MIIFQEPNNIGHDSRMIRHFEDFYKKINLATLVYVIPLCSYLIYVQFNFGKYFLAVRIFLSILYAKYQKRDLTNLADMFDK